MRWRDWRNSKSKQESRSNGRGVGGHLLNLYVGDQSARFRRRTLSVCDAGVETVDSIAQASVIAVEQRDFPIRIDSLAVARQPIDRIVRKHSEPIIVSSCIE